MTKLADEIDYQHDAIVSKVLARSAGGNVTLLAFAAGQELSEHTTPFEALIVGVEGTADAGIGGDRHRVGEGDLLRLPPAVPHWVKATEPFKMLLILLKDGHRTPPG